MLNKKVAARWFFMVFGFVPMLALLQSCNQTAPTSSPQALTAKDEVGSLVTATVTVPPKVVDCDRNPCNLVCSGNPDGTIRLTWNAAQMGIFRNPDGYTVLRSPQSGGPYEVAQTVPIPDGTVHLQTLSVIDNPGPGTWCYVVQAFRVHPQALSGTTNECCEAGLAPTPTETPQVSS